MPTPDSHNPFLELLDATSKIDPGALVTLWANLPPHPPGFTGDLFERFDDIDRDGDGFISRDELDWACGARRFRSHQAAALAALRRLLFELEGDSDGMPRSHAYSVLSFDASSDAVYLRNPWGTDGGGPQGGEVSEGCFKLSLEMLERNFRKIVYEC